MTLRRYDDCTEAFEMKGVTTGEGGVKYCLRDVIVHVTRYFWTTPCSIFSWAELECLIRNRRVGNTFPHVWQTWSLSLCSAVTWYRNSTGVKALSHGRQNLLFGTLWALSTCSSSRVESGKGFEQTSQTAFFRQFNPRFCWLLKNFWPLYKLQSNFCTTVLPSIPPKSDMCWQMVVVQMYKTENGTPKWQSLLAGSR